MLSINDLRIFLEKEKKETSNYFEWHNLAIHLIKKSTTEQQIYEICNLMEIRIDGYSKESYLVSVYTSASERLYQLGYIDQSKQIIQKAFELTKPTGWATYWDGGAKHSAMRQIIKVKGIDARKEIVNLYVHRFKRNVFADPEEMIKSLSDIAQVLFDDIPYSKIWPDIEYYLDELFSGTVVEAQPNIEEIIDSSNENLPDNADSALAELLIIYLDFPAYPISNKTIYACSKSILAESKATKNALLKALGKHDQLVRQGLIVLEIVSLQKPSEISFFQEKIIELQKSPNIDIRMIATKILINVSDKLSFPPIIDRSVPSSIYSLHLPDMAIHHTERIRSEWHRAYFIEGSCFSLKAI